MPFTRSESIETESLILARIQNGIDPERVQDALRGVVGEGDYQSALPGASRWTEPAESSTWVQRLLEWIFGFNIPGQILIVLLVAVATVLLVLGETVASRKYDGPGIAAKTI